MSRLVDIDNYLVLENGTIKETSFKQDIQIQNQTLMINEDAKVQIIYKTTEEGTYQFNIEIKDRLHVDLVEMYEASKSCSYTKNIKINESSEVLRYVEKNSHQNIQLDLDENVDVYKYARVSCAYVELTDYTTLSKIKYRLLEEEASAKLRLASLSKEKENKHYEMTLEHLAPHTYGDMDNYGIVKSKASLIIDGVGRIYKGMSGSDTHQTNKIIVFDEGCKAQANPYLYIDEYDVKASHGASVGKIDEDHLYYLMSRGLSKQDAMHLVTYGYFLPVLEFISVESLKERFEKFDKTAEYNQMKVIKAMQDEKVAEMHLSGTTGYGYNDDGRDTLEKIYSDIFKTEDALVRPQIICGTHALNVALSSNLRPGDELLSPVGKPYDTMDEIIGIRPSKGSLAEYGITYAQVDLLPDGGFDYEGIKNAINESTKLVTIQRSKGYASRPTLSVERIGELISFIKSIKPDVICMVDNCYGEFVERIEPSEVGADMIVGSLIKNPGGGLAPCGGYIAGKKECVEQAAYRLSSPGLGKEVGATLGVNQSFYQGLFLSPVVVAGALKGAIFAANVYEKAGFVVRPDGSEPRYDIIQAVELGSADGLLAFCKGIQAAAPVDSFVTPEPWPMPGYDSDVIMAAGAFVQGSSIELSADGPLKEPYSVFFQGGLTWYHAKLGIMMSVQKMFEKDLIKL